MTHLLAALLLVGVVGCEDPPHQVIDGEVIQNPYHMKHQRVGGGLHRSENEEAICYRVIGYEGGVSCKWKDK